MYRHRARPRRDCFARAARRGPSHQKNCFFTFWLFKHVEFSSLIILSNQLEYVMARFPWPFCTKCGREVELIATSLNPSSRNWTVVAFCHGEREAMYFDISDEKSRGCRATVFQRKSTRPAEANPHHLPPGRPRR